jgi:hypothetical protein
MFVSTDANRSLLSRIAFINFKLKAMSRGTAALMRQQPHSRSALANADAIRTQNASGAPI